MPPPPPATPEPSGADPSTPASWDRLLRDACRLALRVALEGEQASPRIAAPAALVPLFRHHRLSAASYGKIREVVDGDGIFRARVAEAASEPEVGRAGWLWLHRPVGWADDPVFSTGATAPAPARRTHVADGGERLREKLLAAEAARKEVATALSAARRENAQLRGALDGLEAQVAGLEEERRRALRSAKALEAELAQARADLKVRRQAMVELEVELAAAREGVPAASDPPPPSVPGDIDRAGLEVSVAAAARAAADLSEALEQAAGVLAGGSPARPSSPPAVIEPPAARRGRAPRRAARRGATLPPGVFDGTPEAHRCLVSSSTNLLVVDGYNLARAAWSDVSPEDERRRTVRLLEAVQARSGGTVVVVFDGQDDQVAPAASRSVRVRFSRSGQTADEVIVATVAETPAERPVVVVSSDRAVQRAVRDLGASTLGSPEFLAVAS